MNLNLKNKFVVIAGSALVAGSLLVTGVAFAATGSKGTLPSGSAPAKADRFNLDQAVANGKLTQAEADVIKQIDELRKATMEKLQTDSKAIIDQAVKDGKITQEQGDQMLNHEGRGGFGPGGGPGFHEMSKEDLKAKLEADVKAGKLTQDQADQILNGEGRPGGFGHGGFGRGGFGHGGFGHGGVSQPSQSK